MGRADIACVHGSGDHKLDREQDVLILRAADGSGHGGGLRLGLSEARMTKAVLLSPSARARATFRRCLSISPHSAETLNGVLYSHVHPLGEARRSEVLASLGGADLIEFKGDQASRGPTAQPDGALSGGRAKLDDEVGPGNASEQIDERRPVPSNNRNVACCGLLHQAC